MIVGDGPARPRARSVGFVPHDELGAYYERAAVVCLPVAARGLRRGRPRGDGIRAAGRRDAVGGLLDAVDDGVTGLLVPPGDVAGLRRALETLLAEPGLRRELGGKASEKARTTLSPGVTIRALLDAYASALE